MSNYSALFNQSFIDVDSIETNTIVSDSLILTAETNQLQLGNTIISDTSSARIGTIPDASGNFNFVTTNANNTFTGFNTFNTISGIAVNGPLKLAGSSAAISVTNLSEALIFNVAEDGTVSCDTIVQGYLNNGVNIENVNIDDSIVRLNVAGGADTAYLEYTASQLNIRHNTSNNQIILDNTGIDLILNNDNANPSATINIFNNNTSAGSLIQSYRFTPTEITPAAPSSCGLGLPNSRFLTGYMDNLHVSSCGAGVGHFTASGIISSSLVVTGDISSVGTPSGYILTATGSGGCSWNMNLIRNTNISSSGASNGNVLTADGSGNTNWAALSVSNINLSTASGTTNYLTFSEGISGNQAIKTNANLTYNALTNVISANATTQTAGTNNTSIATTAFCQLLLPVGTIMMFGWKAITNDNWMICNGLQISRTTYSALFTAIGTTYGIGDGATTFNVPDFRAKMPLGHLSGSYEIGLSGGAATTTLATANLPAHNHAATGLTLTSFSTSFPYLTTTVTGAAVMRDGSDTLLYQSTSVNEGTIGGNTANTGSGTAFNTISPFLAIQYIIKVL